MIYVDQSQIYPRELIKAGARHAGTKWCHLWSSTNDEAELLAFAKRVKLKPTWIQRRPGFPHFDLTPSRRRAAILQGAIEKPLREWIRERVTLQAIRITPPGPNVYKLMGYDLGKDDDRMDGCK